MKWFSNPCRRHRECLCLLASGLLSEPDRARIENHLLVCADCRSYYNQIKAMTLPLAGWEKHFANLEPTADAETRRANAIREADRSRLGRRPLRDRVVWNVFYELFWPSRHIWTGLAAIWVLILAVNVFMRASSQTVIVKYSPTPEMIMSFRQRQKILAELIGSNEPRAARPPKVFSPQPSSQRSFEIVVT